MADETYNGWKNYPTWAVHLWLTNEQGSYDECLRTAGDALRHSDTPTVYLADALKDMHNEVLDERNEDGRDVFSDLLGYALDCVDWHEIAKAFLDDESLDTTRDLAARMRA